MLKKKSTLKTLNIEQITPGPYQPRTHFDAQKLKTLADSIKANRGIINPILVRPKPKPEAQQASEARQYEIVAGECRWRAAQMAHLKQIDCLVKHYSDDEAMTTGLIENLNRQDLNPIEEATAYHRMAQEFGYSQDEIAHLLAKPRTSITNSLRLLKLDARIQQGLIEGKISLGHGKVLLSAPASLQYQLACQTVAKHWSVQQLSKEVKRLSTNLPTNKAKISVDPNIESLEQALSQYLGSQVRIASQNKNRGYVQIHFQNLDILAGILDKMGFQTEEADSIS